jgi:hypothetical protein
MKTTEEIYKWLKSQNYQTEFGEQEYRMYYAIDMPKILEAYHESRMKEIPEITDEEIEVEAQELYKAGMALEDESRISYTHKQVCLHETQGKRAGAKWYRDELKKRLK